MRARESTTAIAEKDQQVMQSQSENQTQSDRMSMQSTIVEDPQNQPSFNLDFEGDPGLWAEVLDSIDINMDRNWVDGFLRGQ